MTEKQNEELFQSAKKEYYDVLCNPDYTFNKGEEKQLVGFINTYLKNHFTGNRLVNEKKIDSNALLSIYANSADKIDINTFWKLISKKIYCYDTKKIFNNIYRRIDFDTFKKGINSMNDYKTVYNHYLAYGIENNISIDEIVKQYNLYLDEYTRRTDKSNYDNVLLYFYRYIYNPTFTIAYRGKSELDSLLYYDFDSIVEKNEKDNCKSDVDYPAVKIVTVLLPKANLDHKFKDDRGDYNSLKNLIPTSLDYNYKPEASKVIIDQFLSLNPGLYFTSDFRETNAFELSVASGNYNKAKEVLDNKDFILYSQDQVEKLRNNETLYYENGYLVDRFSRALVHSKLKHNSLLALLCNPKVKMIDMDILDSIRKAEDLTRYEFDGVLNYMDKNGIIIYKKDEYKAKRIDPKKFDSEVIIAETERRISQRNKEKTKNLVR